jgi:hypothetical protein
VKSVGALGQWSQEVSVTSDRAVDSPWSKVLRIRSR